VTALVLAWIIGVYVAGMSLGEVVTGFPAQLFLTLAGVTLFFSVAQANGTLAKIAHRSIQLNRGNVGLIPIMFFILAMGLAFIGPGSIASVALLAPTAMAVAGQSGISAFLMAIMIAHGSSAASLSPYGPTGIVVNNIMNDLGFPDLVWSNFLAVAIAHTTVGFLGYFAFGGLSSSRAPRAALLSL
jgi:Mg2+/citrate symporter